MNDYYLKKSSLPSDVRVIISQILLPLLAVLTKQKANNRILAAQSSKQNRVHKPTAK